MDDKETGKWTDDIPTGRSPVGLLDRDGMEKEEAGANRKNTRRTSAVKKRQQLSQDPRHRAKPDLAVAPADIAKRLTDEEYKIWRMMAEGHREHDIGTRMGFSPEDAKRHMDNIMSKLGQAGDHLDHDQHEYHDDHSWAEHVTDHHDEHGHEEHPSVPHVG